MVLVGVVVFVVDTQHDGDVFTFSGSRDYNFLGSSFDVLRSPVAVTEDTGGFQNHIYTQLTPRQIFGVALAGDADLVTVDDQVITIDGNFPVKATIVAVVLKEMSVGFGRNQVIDSYYFDVFVVVEHGFESLSTDTAEAVDCYFSTHRIFFPPRAPRRAAVLSGIR